MIVSDRWLHDCVTLARLLDYRPYLLPRDHPTDFDVPPALEQVSDSRSASHSPLSSPELQPYQKRNRTTTPARAAGPNDRVATSTEPEGFDWAVGPSSSPPASPEAAVAKLRLSSASPSLLPYPTLPSPDDYTPFPRAADHLLPGPGKPIDPASLPTLACKRPSPLYCINQRLCEELQVILLWKQVGEDDLGGGAGLTDKHALSYKRAISVSLLSCVRLQYRSLIQPTIDRRSRPTRRRSRQRPKLGNCPRSAPKLVSRCVLPPPYFRSQ